MRELHNVMERAAIVSQDRKLVLELTASSPNLQTSASFRTEAQMQELARTNLIATLRETQGRISGPSGAAALLGVKPTTLYSRIKAWQIVDEDWA